MRNRPGGLDLADKPADYTKMDAGEDNTGDVKLPSAATNRSRRAVWMIVLLLLVTITILAFGAYRQPELLLNLIGLRYCG